MCREHKRSSSAWFWPAASRVASRKSVQCSQAWPGMHALVALSRTTCVASRVRGVNTSGAGATLSARRAAPQDICEERRISTRPWARRRAVCWIRRGSVCHAPRHLRRDLATRPRAFEHPPFGVQQPRRSSPRSRRRPWPPPTRPTRQDSPCTPRHHSHRAVSSACGDDAAASSPSDLLARARQSHQKAPRVEMERCGGT